MSVENVVKLKYLDLEINILAVEKCKNSILYFFRNKMIQHN